MSTHLERILARVDRTGDCWLWLGATDKDGYGKTSVAGRSMRVHRVVVELISGQSLPPDVHLDHLCRVRRCCNPEHLEPVTAHENWERSDTPSRVHRDKTHCQAGHEFTPENTYVMPNGGRRCVACHRAWQRDWSRSRPPEKVAARNARRRALYDERRRAGADRVHDR